MMTVELQPAYSWICENPSCLNLNFHRGFTPDISEEEAEELKYEYGIEPDELGIFIQMPEEVECEECGWIFTTRHYGEEIEEN